MQPIKLMLTVEDINRIFGALGRMSYESVADLFDKIRAQANPQLAAMQAIEQPEPEDQVEQAPVSKRNRKETIQ